MKLKNDEIDEIMSMAFYDGIAYWAVLIDVNKEDVKCDVSDNDVCELLSKGAKFRLCETNNYNNKFTLTKEKLQKGYDLFMSGVGHNLKIVPVDCMDSLYADIIVQLGLFGEVIYG